MNRDGLTSQQEPLLPVIRVGEIPLEAAPRRWLIEGLWGASAVGLVGGAPKSYKSWLGLEMAVSVATGTKCLAAYPVLEPGHALIYLAEDSLEVVRERVGFLARHRGVCLSEIDLHVITAPSLRLDQRRDQALLFETAQRLRPRLLVLDPLVRLHRVDENNATEISELLSYLRDLQRNFDLAVVVVHHCRKNGPAGATAGQGLRGSGDLHAFGDSNLYLRRQRGTLVLTMEHRAAAAPEPVCLRLVTQPEESIHLEVVPNFAGESQGDSLEEAVLRALDSETVLTREKLRAKLGVKNERLGSVLLRLEREGRIERGAQGWSRLSISPPTSGVPRSPS